MADKPKVKLVGEDGNAFSVIGRCCRALKEAGYSEAQVKAFTDEATSGDYSNVLATAMAWCDVV